jgi:rRNA maturation RNase YbeY
LAVRNNNVLLGTEGLAESAEVECLLADFEKDGHKVLNALKLCDKELSIVLCGDEFIRELNAEHRGKDQSTDVLSFPLGHIIMLGDVVISVKTAERQAFERNKCLQSNYTLKDEMRVLLLHGVLHLIGYDHESGSDDYDSMATAEKEAMEILDWKGFGLIESVEKI